MGHRTTVTLDAAGRELSRSDGLGRAWSNAYDAGGLRLSSTDPAGKTTSWQYDPLGRPTRHTDAAGGVTITGYDTVGNATHRVDPVGNRTTMSYDGNNRMLTQQDGRGHLSAFGYDTAGNRTRVVDPSGNVITLAYDTANRLTRQTDPLGVYAEFTYNAAGQVVSQTDRLGRVRTRGYDGAGRLASETWSTGGGLAYSYDANGNTTSASSPKGTYTYTFDALDRLTVQTDLWGLSTTLAYDAAGRATQVNDGLGGVTTYAYDNAGAVTSVRFGGVGQTPLRQDRAYDNRGMLASVTRYSDLAGTTTVGSSAYAYDNAGRTTSITHKNGAGGTLSSHAYTYDAAGRLTSESTDGVGKSYTYDASNQLTGAGSEAFTYDASGNRTMAGYVVGAGNRVTSDGTWSYTYNAEGQRTKRTKGVNAETWTYGYDIRGQMAWAEKRATDGGTLLQRDEYAYDHAGNRVESTRWLSGTGTQTYRTAMDPGGEAWADLTGANALIDRYVRVGGEELPVARVDGSGVSAWLHGDRQESLRLVTDGAGTQRDKVAYTGFGAIASETDASWGGRFKYTAQESEASLGLQRHGWRWYDTGTGTWTTEDPIGLQAGDYNLTRYVFNGPTNGVDPSGLEGEEVGRRRLMDAIFARRTARLAERERNGFLIVIGFHPSSPQNDEDRELDRQYAMVYDTENWGLNEKFEFVNKKDSSIQPIGSILSVSGYKNEHPWKKLIDGRRQVIADFEGIRRELAAHDGTGHIGTEIGRSMTKGFIGTFAAVNETGLRLEEGNFSGAGRHAGAFAMGAVETSAIGGVVDVSIYIEDVQADYLIPYLFKRSKEDAARLREIHETRGGPNLRQLKRSWRQTSEELDALGAERGRDSGPFLEMVAGYAAEAAVAVSIAGKAATASRAARTVDPLKNGAENAAQYQKLKQQLRLEELRAKHGDPFRKYIEVPKSYRNLNKAETAWKVYDDTRKSVARHIRRHGNNRTPVVVELVFEPGMDRNAFIAKAQALHEMGERGLLVKSPYPTGKKAPDGYRNPEVNGEFKRAFIAAEYDRVLAETGDKAKAKAHAENLKPKMQADHIHELQLLGRDHASNLSMLDTFTNNTVGSQISRVANTLSPLTPVRIKYTLVPR